MTTPAPAQSVPWIDRAPTPVEVDRVVHAFMEVKHRPVFARLAQVRRHGKGGLA